MLTLNEAENIVQQDRTPLGELVSLRDIIEKTVDTEVRHAEVESYIRLSDILEEGEDDEYNERDQSFIVKRINLTFNGKECQVLNFTDITNYKRLKREEEKGKLIKLLN